MAAPTGDQERELDDVLAKIDLGLNKVHRKAKKASSGPRAAPAATRVFSPSQLKRTRLAFQAMCDDSMLSDSGEDLRPHEPEGALPDTVVLPPPSARQNVAQKAATGSTRVNGARTA